MNETLKETIMWELCKRSAVIYFLVFSPLLLMRQAFSQGGMRAPEEEERKLEKLSKGDKVPDIMFQLLNASAKSVKLSELKGKITILDFWGTWCTPCIEKFPFLDSLQKKHADKLNIILINRDNLSQDKEKVNKFLQRYNSRFKDFSLPIAVYDTTAVRYFPHLSVPHYVWIDANGVFLASTSGDEITSEAIENVYEGKSIKFALKEEDMNFKPDLPLFYKGNGGEERNVRVKTTITGYIDGVQSGQYLDYDRKEKVVKRYFIRNTPFLHLLYTAYGAFYPLSRTIFDVKDINKYIQDPQDKSWVKNNNFCYEKITSPISLDKLWKNMQNDLYNSFGVVCKKEKRKVKCAVIVTDLKIQQQNPQQITRVQKTGNYYFTVKELVSYLNDHGRVPFFSGVPSNDLVAFEISKNEIYNRQDLEKFLAKQGYRIVEEERELDCFVISEE